jgi:signal transduction histidine kinase
LNTDKASILPWSAAAARGGRSEPVKNCIARVRTDVHSVYPGAEAYASFDALSASEAVAGFLATSVLVEDGGLRGHPALPSSPEELREFSELLVSVQENERRRIALDLHDGLGQTLSLIKLSIEHSARLLVGGATAEAETALQQLLPRVREALAEVRRVSSELRPPILDDLGLLPTISWLVREFSSVTLDVQVEASLTVAEHEVPSHLHITIFRIVQEAFHNVAKHSNARNVRVRLDRADAMLHLWVEDDGRGFDPLTVRREAQGRGLGLLSMRERTSLTGGTYRLNSARGQGTSIRASWPCTTRD